MKDERKTVHPAENACERQKRRRGSHVAELDITRLTSESEKVHSVGYACTLFSNFALGARNNNVVAKNVTSSQAVRIVLSK